jgi:hypothetical protein
MLYSLSKSFTSTAIGIAQAEGLLSINDPVIKFFSEEAPKDPSQNMRAMRISDLLKMNSGHNEDATGRIRLDSANWVKAFLSLDVEHKPGTHFVYNSAATFMLSAIIQKVTNKTLLEYLTPRLFEPLGIENPTWETSPGGINTGGWGLKIRTKDIASLGQLYLQKGIWQGKQLIPQSWVEEATKLQTSNGSNPESDWEQGYGYQFWRCRHNLYRGDGAFGQYCIVFPEQDAVLAITSGTGDMGAIMNLVWDYLLPALQKRPLEENKTAFEGLQNKLSGLHLSTVKSEKSSPLVKALSNKTYVMEPNEDSITSITFNLKSKEPAITFTKTSASVVMPLGDNAVKKSVYLLPSGDEAPAATSGGWISRDTLQMRTYLYETPFYYTYTFTFNKGDMTMTRKSNVRMGSTPETLEIKGKVK